MVNWKQLSLIDPQLNLTSNCWNIYYLAHTDLSTYHWAIMMCFNSVIFRHSNQFRDSTPVCGTAVCFPMALLCSFLLLLLVMESLVRPCSALDNGLALTPPMGFRTWNQFGLQVNQTMMEDIVRSMSARTRTVDSKPTSLVDLGYKHAGIDDGWQLCNSGPSRKGFHNASGFPIVDTTKFPNMRALTAFARSHGVTPGWYANNCHCADHSPVCTTKDGDYHPEKTPTDNLIATQLRFNNMSTFDTPATCYVGDVSATLDFGFASIKVDGCGAQHSVKEYSDLFNKTETKVLIENCHEGTPSRSASGVECPMHLFRTSDDIRPTYGARTRF